MTKEELKALVATKIEGQGNQVDLGSALSSVLNELIDGMGGGEPTIIDVPDLAEYEGQWKDVSEYFRGKFDPSKPFAYALRAQGRIFYFNGGYNVSLSLHCTYGYYDNNVESGEAISLEYRQGTNTYKLYWSDLG